MSNKYDSYKDSGIEWIGKIPSHWETSRLCYIGEFTSSGIDKKINLDEPFVKIINFTDIYKNKTHILDDNIDYMVVTAPENKIKQNLVQKGDLIFLPSSETYEDLGLSALVNDELDNTSFSYHVINFRISSDMNHNFRKYLTNNNLILNQFSREGQGTTRKIIGRNVFRNIKVVIPPIHEQTTIANYLDKKTTQIDHLIAKKEQFIQLLEEERVAVINQAVTKGLDPKVPMKDSGIDWLGEIPVHWEVKKLKYLVDCNRNTLSENSEPTQIINYIEIGDVNFEKGIIGYTEYSFEKAPSRARRIVHSEDVIVSTVRTYLKAIATVKEEFDGFIASTGFAVLTPKEIYFKLLSYLVLTNGFIDSVISLSKGVSYPSITSQDLLNISICLPNNIEEQHSISCHLDAKISEINKIIAKSRQEIELLKEYKTALISEVVTGKVDVRNEKLN